MIPITKGMSVPDAPSLVVTTDDGRYGDFDLIQCADVTDQTSSACAYQAQFIRYGKMVYQYQTPETLGEAIVAFDPESTHDAAQLWREELARKVARDTGTLTPENPTPAPDAVESTERIAPVDTQEPNVQDPTYNADSNGTVSSPNTADTPFVDHAAIPDEIPPLAEVPVDGTGDIAGMSTTTVEVDTATTTAVSEAIPPVDPTTSTSSLQTAPAIDLSTTSPE